MKYLLLLTCFLLSKPCFSQSMGNQGNKRSELGGDGAGRGIAIEPYQLTGRAVIHKTQPQPKNCQESGRVVIDIFVDQLGTVVEAKVGRGSTTSALCLVEACKAAALATTWSKDTNALDKQRGRIIYQFKIE